MRKILFAMMMICFIMNSGFKNESKSIVYHSVVPKDKKSNRKDVMVELTTEDIQVTNAYKIVFYGNNVTYAFDVPSSSFSSIGQVPEGWYTVRIFTKLALENIPYMFFWLGYYGEGSYSNGQFGSWPGVYVSNESNNMVGILPQ